MHSKIYAGQVSHMRYMPNEHGFRYRMFMMYLDLDELPWLFDKYLLWSARRFNLAYFDRAKHVGASDVSLKKTIIDLVRKESGLVLTGPVRLLTNLKYFGYGFNPVSFYYCFDSEGMNVEAIVVEVNNTPWGEQHCYVLNLNDIDPVHNEFYLEKQFHVSPFNPMDQKYIWKLSSPDEHLNVYMQNYNDGAKVFDPVLSLSSKDINHLSLSKVLFRFPFMTMKIVGAIYYEALKLWLKRTPVYDHPGNNLSQITKKQ